MEKIKWIVERRLWRVSSTQYDFHLISLILHCYSLCETRDTFAKEGLKFKGQMVPIDYIINPVE